MEVYIQKKFCVKVKKEEKCPKISELAIAGLWEETESK